MENYEKMGVIGRGAYGIVHLCRRKADKKMVIIKQIPVEQMTRDERQAALNEVKVLAMLSHPNIIEYYQNFLEDKALMIVMEYAEGGTLFDFLQSKNDQLLEEQEILRFFAQMLLSLQHVHSKQILHRDLKTQNILLDKKKKCIKIGDFGISKVLSSKSKAYTVVGTPCYISPELCEGKPYNQKSDIWALGCVVYEMTTLKRAFEAQNLPALILKIMRGTFSPIADHFSDDLRQLILSMLHLDPSKRPSINQIMAMPCVMNTLMYLYTDFGAVPCRRMPKSMPRPGNLVKRSSTSSSHKGSSCSGNAPSESSTQQHEQPSMHVRPISLCHVYTWGSGIGTPVKLPLPSYETVITQVSAGRTQKAAVSKNGRIFIWETPSVSTERVLGGAAEPGSANFIPRYLEGQSAVTIAKVACGDLFTACVTDRGILMTFGSGANGCLGHGNYNDVSQAKIVEKLLGFEVTSIATGASHMLAVTNEHEVFAWGRGDNGRLGLGSSENTCVPMQVDIPDNYKAAEAFCGVDCSVILTTDGKMLCCGSNRSNKLGLDNFSGTVDEVDVFTPVCSPPINNMCIIAVAMGTSHTVIINDKGEVYTFGANQFGQLGHGSDTPNNMPHRVMGLVDKPVQMIECGDTYTVAVTKEADVMTWGKSSRGRLGRAEHESSIPKKVVFPGNDDQEPFIVTSVSCSHGTTLIATKTLTRTGSLPRAILHKQVASST